MEYSHGLIGQARSVFLKTATSLCEARKVAQPRGASRVLSGSATGWWHSVAAFGEEEANHLVDWVGQIGVCPW